MKMIPIIMRLAMPAVAAVLAVAAFAGRVFSGARKGGAP